MAKLIGLDKVARLFQILKTNGGIRASLYKLYRYVFIEYAVFSAH